MQLANFVKGLCTHLCLQQKYIFAYLWSDAFNEVPWQKEEGRGTL